MTTTTASKRKTAQSKTSVPKKEAEVKEQVVQKDVVPTPPPTPKKFEANELIPCKSVRYGQLTFISPKSGNRYEWTGVGDICNVEYGDLLSLRASKSKFLYEPWILILDNYIVEQWKLTDMYAYYDNLDNLEDLLLKKPDVIKNTLAKAPHGYQEAVVYTVGNMLREGQFDSISTLKVIDSVMHTKLSSMVGD